MYVCMYVCMMGAFHAATIPPYHMSTDLSLPLLSLPSSFSLSLPPSYASPPTLSLHPLPNIIGLHTSFSYHMSAYAHPHICTQCQTS